MNEVQSKVDSFIKKYKLESPIETKYIDLVSEIGELGKEIIEGTNYGNTPFEKTENLEYELGDAFFSLICLANKLDYDLNDALDKVLDKYNKRFLNKGNIGSK